MLSYKNRFHGHGSLRYVQRNGSVRRSLEMQLRYLENPRRKDSRFAVVVSIRPDSTPLRHFRIARLGGERSPSSDKRRQRTYRIALGRHPLLQQRRCLHTRLHAH